MSSNARKTKPTRNKTVVKMVDSLKNESNAVETKPKNKKRKAENGLNLDDNSPGKAKIAKKSNNKTKGKSNETVVKEEQSTKKHGHLMQVVKDNKPVLPNSCSRRIWTVSELLAELQKLPIHQSQNIVKLFEEENTIPFICRYRKELIGTLSPDELRNIKLSYNQILTLQKNAHKIVSKLEKDHQFTEDMRIMFLRAKTMDELEHLYAPFKPTSKKTLAERARSLGLESPAEHVLYGRGYLKLSGFVNPAKEGLQNESLIVDGIKHIISHIISKTTEVLEETRRLQKNHNIALQTTKCKEKLSDKTDIKILNKVDPIKFESYFNFKNSVNVIKPHQILAINRGEQLKVLSVKIIVSDQLRSSLKQFVTKYYLSQGENYQQRHEMFTLAFERAYEKNLQPLICRQIRSELTKTAEKASVEVFAINLKQLLLTSPVKGQTIVGIDPGFSNGCKIALISEQGDVLETCVIYPHTMSKNAIKYGIQLADMMKKHNCTLIALGNGTACRETEAWITKLIENKILNPEKTNYSIVTEQGVSIYSCSDIARMEFPNLEVNLISAVSIARRLNDPLAEYVKVEPKHLGVGMYQHDVNEKFLAESLNEVVSQCVSDVGVDVNTASVSLLRHIAGLTEMRAKKIVEYRIEHGPFQSRIQLKNVNYIGEKTFTQCAGFIRIEPATAGNSENYNMLDMTWVHPESYDLAKKIIRKCDSSIKDIGKKMFIEKIRNSMTPSWIKIMAVECGQSEERLNCIMEALLREPLKDYRMEIDKKPLFKQGLTKMTDLKVGTIVSGAVTNVTHFGCFVDLGVEKNGLIHSTKMNKMTPNVGDRVEASVIGVDTERGRIQLNLVRLN